jgi:hypothetical protein
MKRIAGIATGCMCILLHAGGAQAVANAAAPLLGFVANARAIGMGDVGVADNSDPSTIFYNPANVIAASRVYVLGAQQRFGFYDELKIRRANAGFSRASNGGWTIGADVSYGKLSYGESVLTDTEGNILATFDSYEDVAALAAGLAFTTGAWEFRFGAGVKRWSANYGPPEVGGGEPVKADAMTFDAGATAVLHTRYGAWNITPAIGVAMMDAGEEVDWGMFKDPLPTRLNFGASVRVDSSPCNVFSAKVPLVSFVCQADGIDPTEGDFEWGIGDEIAVAQILFLRTGVRRYASTSNVTDHTYASWGAGLGFPAGPLRARFDYGRQKNAYEKDHMDVLVEWTF